MDGFGGNLGLLFALIIHNIIILLDKLNVMEENYYKIQGSM
jgi:hypothetical protein